MVWPGIWGDLGQSLGQDWEEVYFKLQMHNLEPADRDSCKIAFVILLTSIKKQRNVEMVAIPLACVCCSAPTMALRGEWRAQKEQSGIGERLSWHPV